MHSTRTLVWRFYITAKNKINLGLYVKCLIFLPIFNKLWIFSTDFYRSSHIKLHGNLYNFSEWYLRQISSPMILLLKSHPLSARQLCFLSPCKFIYSHFVLYCMCHAWLLYLGPSQQRPEQHYKISCITLRYPFYGWCMLLSNFNGGVQIMNTLADPLPWSPCNYFFACYARPTICQCQLLPLLWCKL